MIAIDPQVARTARRLGVQHGLRASEIYLALRAASQQASPQDAAAAAEYVCQVASSLSCSFKDAQDFIAEALSHV